MGVKLGLNNLQAKYKLTVRILMDQIENLYFIRIHYISVYIYIYILST